MKWMERMFAEVVAGKPPALVDLPTGAGKTEVVIIWLLALAWYGLNPTACKPVPRRLVWVVNRRVLVQQVFRIADGLRVKLLTGVSEGLDEVAEGLRAVSGSQNEFLRILELRGQILHDREWAIRPELPQLIIGTVDQIGSRLLFQGYGLGKWGRPQQAALFGVDAWVAVDEAHLVPAFVLTLRQLRTRCSTPTGSLPTPFEAIFSRLPFWFTELSATPGLPHPSAIREELFELKDDEKADLAIEDRILAVKSRRVQIQWLSRTEKPKEVLADSLTDAAVKEKKQCHRLAIFVREVGVADRVAKGLKKSGIPEENICKVTGRIRGYERDRLASRKAFEVFRAERTPVIAGGDCFFLVGTAAAEVGLDADADMILCDFAPLPTLLQRLGRLDRRGVLSRGHANNNGDAPTMRIFVADTNRSTAEQKLQTLAAALKKDCGPYSAELMAGAHWATASEGKKDREAEPSGSREKSPDKKSSKDQSRVFIDEATWKILNPTDRSCTSPQTWLAHDLASITAGPVVVPPLTDAVLDFWSATTENPSRHLSPHPFLYGLAEDEEGTPLVGVAFRLEAEALREPATTEHDNLDAPDPASDVLEIFERFPPLRAELHQIKLPIVRDWLGSPSAEQVPLVFRSRDQWYTKRVGESANVVAGAIGPNSTLILPASSSVLEACKKLLEESQEIDGNNTALRDVLVGVSTSARYRREIEPTTDLIGGEGAFLWAVPGEPDEETPGAGGFETYDRQTWKPVLAKSLLIGGSERKFQYLTPREQEGDLQYLDDRNDRRGHLSKAEAVAARLAEVIAPSNHFLRTLLSVAARKHDEGKRHPKWQRAFGRRGDQPELAKLEPKLKKPTPLHGFRHEWESLRSLVAAEVAAPSDIPAESQSIWRDLLLHLVVAHHGHLRPSIGESGLTPGIEPEKQIPLRLEATERFIRLQCLLGRWRLAYLEALMKAADAAASRVTPGEEPDEY
jgi:CRISPR-associated endonuclease/helicase Cas3